MKILMSWKEAMSFVAQSDSNTVSMDAKSPIGHGTAMTPKELVAAGLGGCTAMDVVALLKKHKQIYKTLDVEVDIESTTGVQPAVFKQADIKFSVTGDINSQILLDSVILSQTKYCGVSAMLVKAFPIRYSVYLNNEKIGEGQSHFN